MYANTEASKNATLEDDIKLMIGCLSEELDAIQGKKILFTGGAGFLGYEFIHLLSRIGENDTRAPVHLTVYDNFSRGRKEWLKSIANKTNIELVDHDISKPLPDNCPRFDYIIHAASIASPTYYRMNPIETIDANVNGLRYLLDYAKGRFLEKDPILGMLFFSTSEVYGDPGPDAIPTPETYRGNVSCTGPRACYDEAKRLGETLCVNFSQKFNVPVKIVRPFNNYGPGLELNDGRLLPDLFGNVLENKDIELLSEGDATRTFCYISDAITGYVKALVCGKNGEPYNIGSDKPEISILDLAYSVRKVAKKLTEYDGTVIFKKSDDPAYLIDNPNRRCPDLKKARSDLNYTAKISLELGLEKALKWHLDNES
jgi:UDP-glucuronate decarboxylase